MMLPPLLKLSLYSVSLALLLAAAEPQPSNSKVILFDRGDTLHLLKLRGIWDRPENQEALVPQAEDLVYQKVGDVVFCKLPSAETPSRTLAERISHNLQYDKSADVYVLLSMTMSEISQCETLKDMLDAMKKVFPSGEHKIIVIAQNDLSPVDMEGYGASTVHPDWPHENASLVSKDCRTMLVPQGHFIVQYLFAAQYHAFPPPVQAVFRQISAVYYPHFAADDARRELIFYWEVDINIAAIEDIVRVLRSQRWSLPEDADDDLEEVLLRMQLVCRRELHPPDNPPQQLLQLLETVSLKEVTFRLLVALIAAIKQGQDAAIDALLQLQTPAIAQQIADHSLGVIAIALVFGRVDAAKKLMAFVQQEVQFEYRSFVQLDWTPPLMAKLLDAMLKRSETNAALLLRIILGDRCTRKYSVKATQLTAPVMKEIRKFVDNVDPTQQQT